MRRSTPLIACLALLGLPGFAPAQEGALYSTGQAARGAVVYREACATCHGNSLRGTETGPPITGAGFLEAWEGRPVAELLEYMAAEMPPQGGAGLTEEDYEDVTAYLLRQYGFPAGYEELRAGSPALARAEVRRPSPAADAGGAERPAGGRPAPEWGAGTRTVRPDRGARFDGFEPVTDAVLQDPDPADWLMWRRTLDGWGYSPLDRIDRGNVDRIRQVWGRAMEPGINEATPLVYDGVMYLVNPGDVIQALDATNGELLWEYRWDVVDDLSQYSDWGLRQRNLTVYGDRIFHTTSDGWLIALDARTGELEWRTRTFDYRDYIDHTSAPIVARGMLISGEHCRPHSTLEGGCAVRAHDPETGEELWRRHVIARPGEPGGDSWDGLPLEERRHASTWLPGSYDPDLDLIYWGTAVPSPSPEVLRGTGEGDLLYTNSTLALDPDDGGIVWYHQHLPRDNWDLDHPFVRLLVDTRVAPDPEQVRWTNPALEPGEERRVVTGMFGKPGIVWSMDRETGEFLWARETIFQNVVADIDPRTGDVTIDEDVIPRKVGEPVLACPSASGGKNWGAGAYSPLTGAMYMSMDNTCSRVAPAFEDARIEDGYAIRTETVIHEDAGGKLGTVMAVSASTGETLWRHDQRASVNMNPLLATGGGLVFGGDMSRSFRAFDQETGEILWETLLHGPATGFPVSYAVDGRQYVAVVVGGGMGANTRLTPEVDAVSGGNAVLVFALPEPD